MAHHYPYLNKSLQDELRKVANSVGEKGILAMDDFNDGIGANLAAVGQENTAENRRFFRQTVLTSPGIENYVSGVILFDETIWQTTDSGTTFPQHLRQLGINPGAKVDTDLADLEGSDGEFSTQGLDDLLVRAKKYKEAGCTFVKWRSSIKIGEHLPSQQSINDTAYLQARYARICQQVSKL